MQIAVIKTGGKQYLVSPGQKIKIEKLEVGEGERVVFDQVFLMADGEDVTIGMPYIEGASVDAKILTQSRSRKVIVFKYHSKTRYRKKKGHRQHFTEVKIQDIKK